MDNLIQVENKQGQLLVSSREVAKNFGKRPSEVNRAISDIITNVEGCVQNCTDLFIESEYVSEQNKQTYKEYLLTKDGFSFLVMGFTGKEAMKWKLKYIDAFNKMEETLKQVATMLTEEQKLQLDIFNAKDKDDAVFASANLDRYRRSQIEEQSKAIEIAKPKVESYDRLLDASGLLSWEQFVKTSHLKVGRNDFMKVLRDKKILLQTGSTPYQSYMNRDYFIVKQVPIPNGSYVDQTFITSKGLNWLMKKCKEWNLFKEFAK